MAKVRTPVEVRWDASHVPAGGFAVFVDRSPLPPGKDLRWIVDRAYDRACLADPACPDASWLRSHRIYVVHTTAATITTVESSGHDRHGGVHRVSVVPLDRDGRRLDEGGDSVELVIEVARR